MISETQTNGSNNPSYSRLAPVYKGYEWLVFGQALQHCRTAFIDQLPQRILSVGEGDGRFSSALLEKRPDIYLEIIEPDPAMRAEAIKLNHRLYFVTSETATPPDALILNFVLDLFTEKDAHTFLDQLPESPTIIIGDFFPNSSFTRILTRLMYFFFRLATGLRTTHGPPINAILTDRGYTLEDESTQWKGYLRSQCWRKDTSINDSGAWRNPSPVQ